MKVQVVDASSFVYVAAEAGRLSFFVLFGLTNRFVASIPLILEEIFWKESSSNRATYLSLSNDLSAECSSCSNDCVGII